jgi:UDPglucose 6-dehydrogenase
VKDFLAPDRVVVGVESERARRVMERLYHPFSLNNVPILYMDILSAEMTKYAANSMLATRVSFMNDIAGLCEIVGADVEAVKRGIGSDTRIGSKFLNAGCGYGGSCFPKDVKALVKTGAGVNHRLELLEAVERVNERQKGVMYRKIARHFGEDLRGRRFALWGLAFKPGTDDMREAPSLALVEQLTRAGATVRAFDPVAMEEARRRVGDAIEYAAGMYDALEGADALVVVTEWPEFKVPKFTFIEKALKQKIIFDGRNIYDPVQMREFGYTYYCVGRRSWDEA